MSTTTTSRWARGPFRPLRHEQYRWLVASVVLELFAAGTWLIAVVWQVIELGGGPAQLSGVVTGWSLGIVLTALVGGVVADRVPQRRILVAVTVVRLLATVAVAALAAAGALTLWQLAVLSLVIGMAVGFYWPAYSALLPSLVPESDLLAANAVEGMLRPSIAQAAGPALASLVVAAWSPAAAFGVVAVLELACLLTLLGVRPVPLRHLREADGRHPLRAAATDLAVGVRYLVRTPWLLATLLFASVMILLIIGPIEVLIPFIVKDGAGGGPTEHAWVMAGYGVGSAVGSLAMGALRLPRRYLTLMVLGWGAGCLPLVVLGVATSVPLMVRTMVVVGVFFSAPQVIWGTLLQRRVPAELLGRVSSLDFFVSLVFMPVSMALAGPVSELIGLRTTFLVVGIVPVVLAVVTVVLARMPADELAHPLRTADA